MKDGKVLIFLLGLLVGAIITVSYYKFIKGYDNQTVPPIKDLSTIPLHTLSNQEIRMADIVRQDDTAVLFLAIRDCYSCIAEGIEDLKILQDKGEDCVIIVISDNREEVSGWAGTIDFDSVYSIKKLDFYKRIPASSSPVLIQFRDGVAQKYNYITI